ncbi:hypothetical protein LTR08_005476 [Meristemomyces frigidus]|nr:hypothetical protein LTR08_005476 [Meristemomyces frigidus]
MLRKLRRSSKDSGPSTRLDRVVATQPSLLEATDPNRPSFFDLPAEIRNAIYELLAVDSILTLPIRKGKQKAPLPTSGLLIASRQCRKEYLPLLYSTAPVIVDIKDFDFSTLMRVVSSLYSTELKALKENPNLIIRLQTQNCTREDSNALRRWLVRRADSLDRLPWRYEAAATEPSGAMGRFRLLREQRYYAERLKRLQFRLEDTLQWELQAIIQAFDRKAAELDGTLEERDRNWDVNARTAARGLPGGGIH